MLVPCRVIEPHMAHFDEFSLSWQTDFLTHPLCYPSNYYVSAGQPNNHLQSHGQLEISTSIQSMVNCPAVAILCSHFSKKKEQRAK